MIIARVIDNDLDVEYWASYTEQPQEILNKEIIVLLTVLAIALIKLKMYTSICMYLGDNSIFVVQYVIQITVYQWHSKGIIADDMRRIAIK